MIGNLLDNAGKWADRQVAIRASRQIDAEAGRPWLEIVIDDDGPGLPQETRASALTRGRRLDETKPGSGLGLSIVSDLVAVHGGEVKLEDSSLGGLRVRALLPVV